MELTVKQFAEKHGLKFSCYRVDARPDLLMDGEGMRHFRCKITSTRGVYQNRAGFQVASSREHSFRIYFSQGSAHTEDPTIEDVLDCLASDASTYDSEPGFEEWAQSLGYEIDSRKAEKIYRAVKRQADELKRLLHTEAYEELLYKTERL